MDLPLRMVAAKMTQTLKEMPPEEYIDAFEAMRTAFFDGLYKKLQLQPDGSVIYVTEGGGKKRRRRHMTKRQRRI